MTATKGYYSIIQYCPDSAKAEGVNVGVALFVPDRRFADVRMSTNNKRARRFFSGEYDNERLKKAKIAIETRIKLVREDFQSIDEIQTFIRRRADTIRLIDPRPMRVENPISDLDNLFAELVEPARLTAAFAPKSPQRFEAIKSIFHAADIQQAVEFDATVTIPIVDKSIRVPFTYKNGQVVHVLTEHFTKPAKIEQLALEGQLMREKLNRRVMIVGATPPDEPELRDKARGLFDFSQLSLFWEDEAERLADKVREDLGI